MINGATTNNQAQAPALTAPPYDIASFIQEYGSLQSALKILTPRSDVNAMKFILAQKDINVNDENGILLQLAANAENIEILDLILRVPNIVISVENRALCRAAIDKNHYDSIHWALVQSCKLNKVGLVKFLISENDVNVNIYCGGKPLESAIKHNSLEVVQLLLGVPDIVPTLEYVDTDFRHRQDIANAVLIAQMLIEHGADVLEEKESLPRLHVALEYIADKLQNIVKFRQATVRKRVDGPGCVDIKSLMTNGQKTFLYRKISAFYRLLLVIRYHLWLYTPYI